MKLMEIKNGLQELLLIIKKPEMAILPGHLAFFLVLAIVPLFLVIIIIANYYIGSAIIVTEFIEGNFPQDVSNILLDIVSKNRFDLNTTIFLLISLFVASGGFYSVIVTANALYGNEQKNVVIRRIKAFLLTVLVFGLFFFMLVVMAFGNNIMNIVSNYITSQEVMRLLDLGILILRWPLAFLAILMVINIVYTIAPDNNIKTKSTFGGALFTTIMWIIATFIYSFWVDNFASYDVIYGSLSTIIVMMIWVYVLSYFLVFGLAINARKYKQLTR